MVETCIIISMFCVIFVCVFIPLVPIISMGRIKKRVKEINEKANEQLNKIKFNISKTYNVRDCVTIGQLVDDLCYRKIFVNSEDKKICFVDYQKSKLVIVDFNEIVGCEIVENSAMEDVGFGNNVSLKEKCSDMKLIIKIDNLENPQVIYNMVFSENKINKSGNDYNNLKNYAQEIKSFIDVIRADTTLKRKKFIYCKYCGAKNNEESLKCESCGGSLK